MTEGRNNVGSLLERVPSQEEATMFVVPVLARLRRSLGVPKELT